MLMYRPLRRPATTPIIVAMAKLSFFSFCVCSQSAAFAGEKSEPPELFMRIRPSIESSLAPPSDFAGSDCDGRLRRGCRDAHWY